jgi:hypothetical protein
MYFYKPTTLSSYLGECLRRIFSARSTGSCRGIHYLGFEVFTNTLPVLGTYTRIHRDGARIRFRCCFLVGNAAIAEDAWACPAQGAGAREEGGGSKRTQYFLVVIRPVATARRRGRRASPTYRRPRKKHQALGDDSRFFNPLCCPPQ